MTLRNDKGYWFVQFRDLSGVRHYKSLKTKDKAKAEQEFEKLKAIHDLARVGAATREVAAIILGSAPLTLEEVINEYKEWETQQATADSTIRKYCTYATKFGKEQGILDKKISVITADMVSDWINDKPEGMSLSYATLNIQLSALKSVLGYANNRGYRMDNPAALVSINRRKLSHNQLESKTREPITEEEYGKIILQLRDGPKRKFGRFFKAATVLSYWAGLRLGDIATLEWDSITHSTITVWTMKRNTRVHLPFDHPLVGNGILRDTLFALPMRDDKYCFPFIRKIYLDEDSEGRLSKAFVSIAKAAGVPGKSFHCLRHSCATRLESAGESLEAIAKYLGHADTETTKGYIH